MNAWARRHGICHGAFCLSAPAVWSIVAAALLSQVLAFLMVIVVEIVLGVLKDGGTIEIIALVAIGIVGWALLGRLWFRPRGRASVGT